MNSQDLVNLYQTKQQAENDALSAERQKVAEEMEKLLISNMSMWLPDGLDQEITWSIANAKLTFRNYIDWDAVVILPITWQFISGYIEFSARRAANKRYPDPAARLVFEWPQETVCGSVVYGKKHDFELPVTPNTRDGWVYPVAREYSDLIELGKFLHDANQIHDERWAYRNGLMLKEYEQDLANTIRRIDRSSNPDELTAHCAAALHEFPDNQPQIEQARDKWQAWYNLHLLNEQQNEQAIQRAVEWITNVWTPVLLHNRDCLARVQAEYNKATLTCYRLEYALFDEDSDGGTHVETEQVYVLNHEPTAEGFYTLAGGMAARMVKYTHVVLLEALDLRSLKSFPGSLQSTHWVDECIAWVLTPNTVSKISVMAALESSGIQAFPQPPSPNGITREQWSAALRRTYPSDKEHHAHTTLWGCIKSTLVDEE